MKNTKQIMFDLGYVPIVSNVKNIAGYARAMWNGEATVMEVDSLESLKNVIKFMPEMIVGISVDSATKCQQVLDAGAKFIICEEWNDELVKACEAKDALLIPTCNSLAAVADAMSAGLTLMNYIPVVGIDNLRQLTKIFVSYADARFIVSVSNDFTDIDYYASAPFVFGLRGNWLQQVDSNAPNYSDQITELCSDIFTRVLGFELAHIGINTENENIACGIAEDLHRAFRVKPRDNGPSSRFVGNQFEVMKRIYRGKNGHFAVATNNVDRAMAYVISKGFEMDMDTAYVSDGRILTVYMKEEYSFGGFNAHFAQKNSPWPRN